MAENYNIIYLGKLQPTVIAADAIWNLTAKFKLPMDRAEELIHSGKPKVIKSGLSQAKAMKYRDMLIKTGLQVKVVEAGIQSSTRDGWPDVRALEMKNQDSANSILAETVIPIDGSDSADASRESRSKRSDNSKTVRSSKSDQFTLVSGWTRFCNSAIDYIAFILLAGIVGFCIGLGGAILGLDTGFLQDQSYKKYVLSFALITLYYVVSEWSTGQTIGKAITGTKVINEEGTPPSLGQVLGRTLTRHVPFEFVTFFGSQSRGLHDKWANTYVVKAD